jgi:carboxyl-terminal processing protease
MKTLILDLRGNNSGYLNVAAELSNQFLKKDLDIVFTEGDKSPKQVFKTDKNGAFTDGKLVILIDEGSASASEIVSGAIQDWDRGVIIGRRSFGKGLVQRPFNLAMVLWYVLQRQDIILLQEDVYNALTTKVLKIISRK